MCWNEEPLVLNMINFVWETVILENICIYIYMFLYILLVFILIYSVHLTRYDEVYYNFFISSPQLQWLTTHWFKGLEFIPVIIYISWQPNHKCIFSCLYWMITIILFSLWDLSAMSPNQIVLYNQYNDRYVTVSWNLKPTGTIMKTDQNGWWIYVMLIVR